MRNLARRSVRPWRAPSVRRSVRARRPWSRLLSVSCATVLIGGTAAACGGDAVSAPTTAVRPATGSPCPSGPACPPGARSGGALQRPRVTPPPDVLNAARPLAERVRARLTALPRDRRVRRDEVRRVLADAGVPAGEIQVVALPDRPSSGLEFGAYTGQGATAGVCVFGRVTEATVEVNVGGVIEDGGCLARAIGE